MKRTTRKIGADRYEDSYATRDKGSSAKDILNYKGIKGEQPPFFKAKEGKNKINIIPFEIKTNKHPLVATKKMEIGDVDYVLDIWVHRNIGPTGTDVVCLKRNYNKACPVCEEAFKMRDAGKSEEYKALKASRRCYYNVIDTADDDEKIQVFNVSHFLFEKELIEAAKDDSDGGETVYFAEIDEGKVVEFRGAKESIGDKGKDMLKFKNFIFRDRQEALDETLIDDAVSFDELIIARDADELEKILWGDDEDDAEAPPAKGKKAAADDEDDGDDASPARKKPPVKEEDDEDEPPARPAKKKPPVEEDEDDEDPAPPAKKKKASGGECPHGFAFGTDCDAEKACIRCAVYADCNTEQERLEKK